MLANQAFLKPVTARPEAPYIRKGSPQWLRGGCKEFFRFRRSTDGRKIFVIA